MTQQQVVNKKLNLTNFLMGLLTVAVVTLCGIQKKFYDSILLQPGIDDTQTKAILILTQENENRKTETRTNHDQILYLNAILPKQDQFKIIK